MLAHSLRGALSASTLLCLSAFPTLAHVTLETQEAHVGSTYKAVLRVPHGCEGAATLKVRVQVPEGVIAVKPMPKAGWTLETVKGAYKQPYDYYGTPMTEGVRESPGPASSSTSTMTSSSSGLISRRVSPRVPPSTSLLCRTARAARSNVGSRSRPQARVPMTTSSRHLA